MTQRRMRLSTGSVLAWLAEHQKERGTSRQAIVVAVGWFVRLEWPYPEKRWGSKYCQLDRSTSTYPEKKRDKDGRRKTSDVGLQDSSRFGTDGGRIEN